MLVKHIVNLLPRMASSSGMTAELMRILSNTVLHINDVFGQHWQQMLDDISEAWSSANGDKHDLASLHFSLRLFSKLKTYVDLQTNEDLVDCWNDSLPKMSKALMTVIQSANSKTLCGVIKHLLNKLQATAHVTTPSKRISLQKHERSP